MSSEFPSILVLSGGVGGAKFADGLYQLLPPWKLSVCVNTGDDFELFGLLISPDLDTVCYTLAGVANPVTGWGLRSETYNVQKRIEELGGPTWFKLGDKDLATHLERTRLLKQGYLLSDFTTRFSQELGIQANIYPMTDHEVRTKVNTAEFGPISFQEYFVDRKFEPKVTGFDFSGIEKAKPARGLVEAINQADVILIGPSNPLVSICPILAISGVRGLLKGKKIIAVSPIVGGKAIKGPLAKMYLELGLEPLAKTVAENYRGLINGFILDEQDRLQAEEINQWDIITLVTNTVMKSKQDRKKLAEEVLAFVKKEITG